MRWRLTGRDCVGQVCHCRLLLWCRFKTRKGLAGVGGAAGAGGTYSRREGGGAGVRERRCSYGLCPQHTSNNRWHLVTPYTNAGGKDWSDLVGQTLCSCCFQQYRGKVQPPARHAPTRRTRHTRLARSCAPGGPRGVEGRAAAARRARARTGCLPRCARLGTWPWRHQRCGFAMANGYAADADTNALLVWRVAEWGRRGWVWKRAAGAGLRGSRGETGAGWLPRPGMAWTG
jgi:hypothetical protein